MRKTKVMVLFLVLTLTTSWAFANNLLQNPSFEDWESGWIRKEIAGATEFEIDEEFAYHGISSARVAASSPAEGYWQQEIPIAVVEGQTYQFSALNRREFIEGGEGAVAVALFRDKAGRTVEEKVLLKGSGTSNWVTMSQQFHVPAKAVTLQIRLGLRNARGAVYWDQLELTASEQGEEQALKIADGFEVNFSNWKLRAASGKLDAVQDKGTKHSGTSAARISSSDASARGWLQSNFEIQGGKRYRISAWVKADRVSNQAGLRGKLFDSGNNYFLMEGNPYLANAVGDLIFFREGGTYQWQEVSGWFDAPADATRVMIDLMLEGSGIVWWDDLTIEEVVEEGGEKLTIVEGFEENGIQAWKLRAASGKLDSALDKATKHSGAQAAQITSSDASARGWLQSNFEIQGGKRYRISAWVKADKVSKQAGLRGKLFDSGNKYFIMEGNPYLDNAVGDLVFFRRGGSYQWQEVSGWFDAPADATRLMVDLMLEGSGAVWWDDLAIEEIEPSSIIEEENGAELTISEGFEKDALASWTLRAASGKLDSALDKATKRSGAQAAQITSIDSNARGWLQRNFQIQGGKRYRISAWVKADRVSKSAGLRAKLFDSGNKYFPMDGNPYLANTVGDLIFFRSGGSYQWQEVSGWFDAPADTARVMVDLMLEGTGTVWWDDLTIEEIDPSTMDEEQVDQIANSEGFERGFNGFNQHSVTGTLNFGLDQEHKHGGNIAAKVSSSTSTARGWLKKTFPIEGGKKYLLRVWTRGEKLLGAGAGLRGKLYNSANKYLPMEDNPFLANRVGDLVFFKLNGSYNWRQAGGWFDTPLDAKTITIDLMLEGSGTVWWDDLTLEQVEEISQDMIRQLELAKVGEDLFLEKPKAGETVPTNPPAFIWNKIGHDITYTMEFSRDQDFKTAKQVRVTEGSIYIPNWLFETGNWFWRVSADVGGRELKSDVGSFVVEEGTGVYLLPSTEEIKAQMPASHPRLFFLKEELPQLRKNVMENSQVIWDQLEENLELNLNTPLVADPAGYPNNVWNDKDWRRIWDDSQIVRNNTINFAFGYLITGKEEYLQAAKRWLLCGASWDPKGATSDASNDEASRAVLEGLGTAYDWLYDKLTAEEREQVLRAIIPRGEEMYTLLTEVVKLENNPYDSHAWNKAGILAQAAVAIYGEHPVAETWLTQNLRLLMGRWPAWGGADGGWSEGVYYHVAYLERFLKPAAALRKAAGVNLYDHPWLRNGQYFLFYGWAPGTLGSEFGDKWPGLPNAMSVMNVQVLAHVKGNPYLQWYVDMAGGVMAKPNVPEGFLWDGRLQNKPPVDLPQAHAFKDVGYAALHSNLTDPSDNIVFHFKSSPYGSISHAHSDQNSFNIGAFGQRLVIDSGFYDYASSPHVMKWSRETIAHNSILVNGQGQARRTRDNGELTGFITSEYFDYVGGEAAAAYEGKIDKFHRQIIHLRPGVYILADDLKGPVGTNYDWLLHSIKKMDIDSNKKQVKVAQADARMDLQFIEPADLTFSQTNKFTADPTTQFTEQWHLKATVKSQAQQQRFLAVMDVYRAGESKDYQVSNLSTEELLALKLKDDESTIIAGFNFSEKAEVADLVTDAQAFAVEYKNQNVGSFLLEKGKYLAVGETTYFRSNSSGSVSLGKTSGGIDGTIQLDEEGTVEICLPMEVQKLLVDGEEVPFTREGELAQFNCEKGEHRLLFFVKNVFTAQEEEVVIKVGDIETGTLRIFTDGIHRAVGSSFFETEAGIYTLIVEGENIAEGLNLKIDHKPVALKVVKDENGQRLIAEGLFMSRNAINLIVDVDTKVDSLAFVPLASAKMQKPIVWEESALAKDGAKVVLIQAENFVCESGGESKLTTTHIPRYGKGITGWGPVGHWLEWEFVIPEAGTYEIIIGAATIYDQVIRSLSIDDDFPLPQLQMLSFSNTGGFGYSLREWTNFQLVDENDKPLTVNLKQGKHKVRMTSLYNYINMDYIAFIKQ